MKIGLSMRLKKISAAFWAFAGLFKLPSLLPGEQLERDDWNVDVVLYASSVFSVSLWWALISTIFTTEDTENTEDAQRGLTFSIKLTSTWGRSALSESSISDNSFRPFPEARRRGLFA